MVEMAGDAEAVLGGLHQGSVAIRKKVMGEGEFFLRKNLGKLMKALQLKMNWPFD